MAQLYFRYGAMGCGKTMQLLQVAFNYEERGQKVCVIKPATDTKNGKKLLTRIGPERDTDFCFNRRANLFTKIAKEYSGVNCILVDEAQFLTEKQVDQLLQVVVKLNIPVIAYGLRLNFRMSSRGFEGSTPASGCTQNRRNQNHLRLRAQSHTQYSLAQWQTRHYWPRHPHRRRQVRHYL